MTPQTVLFISSALCCHSDSPKKLFFSRWLNIMYNINLKGFSEASVNWLRSHPELDELFNDPAVTPEGQCLCCVSIGSVLRCYSSRAPVHVNTLDFFPKSSNVFRIVTCVTVLSCQCMSGQFMYNMQCPVSEQCDVLRLVAMTAQHQALLIDVSTVIQGVRLWDGFLQIQAISQERGGAVVLNISSAEIRPQLRS